MASPAALRTIHAVLRMSVDLSRSAEDLNECLKVNRKVIDRLQQVAPDLWEELRNHTQAKRSALQAAAAAEPKPQPHRPAVQRWLQF